MTRVRRLVAIIAVCFAMVPITSNAQNLSADAPKQTMQIEAGSGTLMRFDQKSESVFVANPAVAQIQPVSSTLAYLTGTRPGVTDVYAINKQENIIAAYRVIVRESGTAAREVSPTVSPDSAINFAGRIPVVSGQVDSVGGGLEAETLRRSLAYENAGAIDQTEYRGPTQVNLRVRFVEINRSDVNNLGFNFGALTDIGNFSLGLATGTATAGVNAVTNGLASPVTAFGTAGAAFSSTNSSAQSLIDALAQTDALEILAEPTLTTVTGREATFLAGGEFPIVVPQDNGAFTTQFREFGVSLGFLPTILPNERIALQVSPEVSTLDFATGTTIGGVTVPGLSTRRISTTVELASGQTFAIGGLFQRDISDSVASVPGVNKVPVLGKLLSSRRFRQNETELMVLVTPYLVGDGAASATDQEASLPTPKLAGFMFARPGGMQ